MKINRRQFFKQVAVACAGIGATAATVVAPAVVKEKPEKCIRGNRVKHLVIANGIDCNAPGRWETYYYTDWPSPDPIIRQKFKAALRSYKFNYPFGKPV